MGLYCNVILQARMISAGEAPANLAPRQLRLFQGCHYCPCQILKTGAQTSNAHSGFTLLTHTGCRCETETAMRDLAPALKLLTCRSSQRSGLADASAADCELQASHELAGCHLRPARCFSHLNILVTSASWFHSPAVLGEPDREPAA